MTTTQNNAGYTGYNLCNRPCNRENFVGGYIPGNIISRIIVGESVYGV